MTHYRLVLVTALALALAIAGLAVAGAPTEQLKPAVDRVISLLSDPAMKGEAKAKARQDAIRAVSNEVFDWAEMAKRALGRHWHGRTEAEREEFVKLFRDLLESSYISTIERYSGEKILYVGDSIDGDHAAVRTKFISKQGQEVPIEYRMIRRADRWLIYDVLLENVGLVSNYRTQFNQIIQTSSYQELVRKMKTHEIVKKAS